MKVVLISLEPWDQVWRRNQYLSSELVRAGSISELCFVEPIVRSASTMRVRPVSPCITVFTPGTLVPRSLGGLEMVGGLLQRTLLANADLLWINDAPLGARCRRSGVPTIYDVTDDWRSAGLPPRISRRIIRAENFLAHHALTIVCSQDLRARWSTRYGLDAHVVHNGIAQELWATARPRVMLGTPPHVGYVGTLHEQRLDLDLIADLSRSGLAGSIHLVGPNCLSNTNTERLAALPTCTFTGLSPLPTYPAGCSAWTS